MLFYLSGKYKKKTQLDCCKFVIFCISHFENSNKKLTMKIKKNVNNSNLYLPLKNKKSGDVTIWNIINLLFIAQVYSAWAHNCMYTWDCIIL